MNGVKGKPEHERFQSALSDHAGIHDVERLTTKELFRSRKTFDNEMSRLLRLIGPNDTERFQSLRYNSQDSARCVTELKESG